MTAPAHRFVDRLVFDQAKGQILDQTRRYMLLRPEALMGIFRGLPEPARLEALAALEASVFEQGSDSARAYRRILADSGSSADPGTGLMGVVAETAPQLGWGLWQFERAGDALIRLEVQDSPFAAGFGPATHPVCHGILGMVRAVASLVFNRPVEAREIACSAMGAPRCLFEARPLSH